MASFLACKTLALLWSTEPMVARSQGMACVSWGRAGHALKPWHGLRAGHRAHIAWKPGSKTQQGVSNSRDQSSSLMYSGRPQLREDSQSNISHLWDRHTGVWLFNIELKNIGENDCFYKSIKFVKDCPPLQFWIPWKVSKNIMMFFSFWSRR